MFRNSFLGKYTRILSVLVVFQLVISSSSAADRTVELGLTPSPVFDLWSNINKALMLYGTVLSRDEAWIKKLHDMEPNKYSNKIPSDVLELVKKFQLKLQQHGRHEDHNEHNSADMLLDGDLPNLLQSDDNIITPSQVYLHSGQVLINITEIILYAPNADIVISPLFKDHEVTDKSPSDVFGLVDLALRRLHEFPVLKISDQPDSRS